MKVVEMRKRNEKTKRRRTQEKEEYKQRTNKQKLDKRATLLAL